MTGKHLTSGLAGALGATVALLLLTPVGDIAWSATRHAVGASHQAGKAAKRGPRGPRGRRGPRGLRGARGLRGPQGQAGLAGARGIQGAKGPKGDLGTRGTTIGIREYCARASLNPYAFPDAPCRAQSYVVDGQDNVGWTPSIAIGIDGNPLISYAKGTGGDLKVARCNDPLCSNGDETLSTVDSAGNVGREDSLAIGADGNPTISYEDDTTHELKVVHCNDAACAGDDEAPHVVGPAATSNSSHTSIAIGTDGNPTISYYLDGDLNVVHCNDPACAGGDEVPHPVDTAGFVGYASSLALGTDGNPVVSYYDISNHDLKVARCNDPACVPGGETLTAVDRTGVVGEFSSLAIGADGNPVISYLDATNVDLKVARCNDPGCTGENETLSTVDDNGSVGFYTSIVIGPAGNPIVSYSSGSPGHLLLARCNDPACAGHNEALSTPDPTANAGQETTIALGLDGSPIIAHWDGNDGDLRVTRPAIP